MANLQLLLEAERRGILPPDKAALLTEARKRGLVPATTAQAPEAAEPESGVTTNPFKGLAARGAELLGSGVELAARAGESIGDFIAEKAPILDTRAVVDEKGARIERPTVDQIRNENQMQYMFDWANSLREWGREINYQPSTKLEDLGDNPLNAVPFIVERVITSAPDMAAAVGAPVPYIATRANEILNERLANDKKELKDATVADVAAATGAAIVEGTLERFATGRLLEKGAEAATGVRRVGKEAGVQAGTEAAEETTAYAGATAGTEAGFDPRTAARTALEAAIVGGGLGAGVQGVREAVRPKEGVEETPPIISKTEPPVTTAGPATPPSDVAVTTEPANPEDLLNAPPKVTAENAPENVRYEPTTLNEDQVNEEIDKLEDIQEQLATLLFDTNDLSQRAALARIPVDTLRQNIQTDFDNNATKLDVFYKHLDGTLPPVKPTVTQEQVTAAGVSPDIAKALNVQPSVTPPATIAPGVTDAAATTAPQITQPPVGGTVGGGTAVPAPRPPAAGPSPEEVTVERVEPPARTPSDVVQGEGVVEPALTGRTSDQIFDEVQAVREQAKSLLTKAGKRPGVGSKKRKEYDALVQRSDELVKEWTAKTVEEERAKATQAAPAAPTPTAPAVQAAPAAPAPTPPTVAAAGAPPTPPTPPTPPSAAPSGAPQPPGRPRPTSPTGQSTIQGIPNATTPSYLGAVGRVVSNLPPLSKNVYDSVRNILNADNIKDNIRKGIYAFLSLPQQVELFAKELPSLRDLLNVINVRASALKDRKESLDRNIRKWNDILSKYSLKQREKFYEIAHESTRLQVDFRDPTQASNPLTQQFDALPSDMKTVYFDMLESYRKMADEYLKLISKNLSPRLVRRLERKMAQKRLKVYLPLFREGDYWLRYEAVINGKQETVIRSFNSNRERELAMKEAIAAGASKASMQPFARVEGAFEQSEAGPFFYKIMEELNSKGVSPAIKRSLFEMYLDLLPAQSVRQQYRTRDGYRGYETDLMNVYATVASRMANQLTNLEFIPEIDKAYSDVEKDANKEAAQARDLAVKSFMNNLKGQMDYLRDPGNGWLVNTLTSFSYYWYIIGNVSTALINLTQLPMVVYPVLAGKYGANDAMKAMTDAQKQYFKGGWDNDNVPGGEKRFPADYSFGIGLPSNSPLKKLYDAAVRQSAIRRSTGYDLIEGRKKNYGMGDYIGLKAKTEQILGWTFQNSERMNREVTLIAAFNLEMQKNGGDIDAAIRFALDTINETHGTTLTETSPRVFQTGFGKVAFTFKNFAQTMIYLQVKLLRNALKGETPEVRKMAAKQFLGISAMAFTFAGIQGMPFFGAATVMADIMHDLLGDEDEPWKAETAVRGAVGSIANKGPVNELLMQDIASRTGFANMLWRDDDKRLEEIGPILFAMEQIFGPSYAALMGIGRGVKDYKEGNYDRAVESFMPSFIRNVLKSYRYASEGALTRDKEVLYDDFNKYELFMQTLGFTPVEVARRSEIAGDKAKKIDDLENRKKALLDRLYLARIKEDKEGEKEAREAINKYNDSETVKAYRMRIDGETISKSFATRRQRSAQSTFGIYSPPKMRPALAAEFQEPEKPILKRIFGDEQPKD